MLCEVDIDGLYEQHHEQFVCWYHDKVELRDLIHDEFFESETLWIIKEYGREPDEAIDEVFDLLYNWDAEYLMCDPVCCANAYAQSVLRK